MESTRCWDYRGYESGDMRYTRGGVAHMTGLKHHRWSLYSSGWVALLALVFMVFMFPTGSPAVEDITVAAANDGTLL